MRKRERERGEIGHIERETGQREIGRSERWSLILPLSSCFLICKMGIKMPCLGELGEKGEWIKKYKLTRSK